MLTLFLAVLTATTAWLLKPAPEQPLRKFTMTIDEVANQVYDGPVVSPDGRMIVYAQGPSGQTTLWIRDLDAVSPRELPDTRGGIRPFWSPNSDFVAYFAVMGFEDINTEVLTHQVEFSFTFEDVFQVFRADTTYEDI